MRFRINVGWWFASSPCSTSQWGDQQLCLMLSQGCFCAFVPFPNPLIVIHICSTYWLVHAKAAYYFSHYWTKATLAVPEEVKQFHFIQRQLSKCRPVMDHIMQQICNQRRVRIPPRSQKICESVTKISLRLRPTGFVWDPQVLPCWPGDRKFVTQWNRMSSKCSIWAGLSTTLCI